MHEFVCVFACASDACAHLCACVRACVRCFTCSCARVQEFVLACVRQCVHACDLKKTGTSSTYIPNLHQPKHCFAQIRYLIPKKVSTSSKQRTTLWRLAKKMNRIIIEFSLRTKNPKNSYVLVLASSAWYFCHVMHPDLERWTDQSLMTRRRRAEKEKLEIHKIEINEHWDPLLRSCNKLLENPKIQCNQMLRKFDSKIKSTSAFKACKFNVTERTNWLSNSDNEHCEDWQCKVKNSDSTSAEALIALHKYGLLSTPSVVAC